MEGGEEGRRGHRGCREEGTEDGGGRRLIPGRVHSRLSGTPLFGSCFARGWTKNDVYRFGRQFQEDTEGQTSELATEEKAPGGWGLEFASLSTL
jgi:hypothetical protein